MKQAIIAASLLLAGTVGTLQAATLDLGNGSFNDTNGAGAALVFQNMVAGVDLHITTQAPNRDFDSNNFANNGTVGDPMAGAVGGQINQNLNGGINRVDLMFSFRDASGGEVFLNDFEIGFYDIDFKGGEKLSLLTPGMAIVTADTDLQVTQSGGVISAFNSTDVSNVLNVGREGTSFDNLNDDQQDASIKFTLAGLVSQFVVRLETTGPGTGRNYQFGNLEFTQATQTVSTVPLPAPGLLLMAGLVGLGALRSRTRG